MRRDGRVGTAVLPAVTLGAPLGPEGSEAIHLSNEKRDDTHTSVHGATVHAGLVRDGLLALHLVPKGAVRVG